MIFLPLKEAILLVIGRGLWEIPNISIRSILLVYVINFSFCVSDSITGRKIVVDFYIISSPRENHKKIMIMLRKWQFNSRK